MTEHDHEPEHHSTAADVVEAVRSLIGMMNDGGIGELDLTAGDVSIHLRTEAVALAANAPVVQGGWSAYPAMPPMYAEPAAVASSDVSVSVGAPAEPEGHIVASPMIGTFYSASAPGEPAFVQVGDEVDTGQVIGIIEAMKIMNEITADRSGVVAAILVENAQAVEYGSPLIRIANTARFD